MSLSPRDSVVMPISPEICFSSPSRWSRESETSVPERVPLMIAVVDGLELRQQRVQILHRIADVVIGILAEFL